MPASTSRRSSQGIDKDLKPESFAFPASFQLVGNVDLERLVKTVHNVAAYLPGTTKEYVILGAHYDHLGLGRPVLACAEYDRHGSSRARTTMPRERRE